MAEITTFIKLDRNIREWRWYKDANTMRVFLHLILCANIKDHDFEQITVHRGECVTSYSSISKALDISLQSVRTALLHLKKTGEITSKPYSKYQVIWVKNFDKYQLSNMQLTGNQQSNNIQSTLNQQQSKNDKNEKKEKKEKKDKNILGEDKPSKRVRQVFIPPTLDEIKTYCQERKNNIDPEYLFDYYTANGWVQGKTGKPIRDWKAVIRTWERNAFKNQQSGQVTERSIVSGEISRINDGII